MTRLGCIADLHLGANPGVGPDRLREQRDLLIDAFDFFVDERVDCIVIAGDIFEGPLPAPEHYHAFANALSAIPDGVPTVAILGNGRHDAATRHVAAPAVIRSLEFEFFSRPGYRTVGDTCLALLPWTSTARLVASENGDAREGANERAAARLLEVAEQLRAKVPEDKHAVLVTHFAISGGTDGLERFAREPVLDRWTLASLGFDAVVAGHFHRPEILNTGLPGALGYALDTRERTGPIFYCGSPYPLSFGEGAYEHGVWILDLGPRCTEARFVALRSRMFETVECDLSWLPDDLDPEAWLTGHVRSVIA